MEKAERGVGVRAHAPQEKARPYPKPARLWVSSVGREALGRHGEFPNAYRERGRKKEKGVLLSRTGLSGAPAALAFAESRW